MNIFFAASDATAAGRVTGQIFVVVLLLFGIFKCVSISKRPTTSSKCVWALALLLIACLLPTVVDIVAGGATQSAGYRVALGFVGLLAMGLIVASVVLAIVGLVEFSSARKRFVQGRAQAIWALVLNGLFFMFIAAAMAGGLLRAMNSKNQPSRVETLSFDELNFRFTTPGRPWVQADAKKVNPYAKLSFIRANPEMYFIVIAEPTGNLDYTTESLAEIGRTRIQSVSESSRVVEQFPCYFSGLSGLEVCTEAKVRDYSAFYVQWFCATNGWAYQMMVWGNQPNRQQIKDEARQLMSGLALMDYRRMPSLARGEAIEDFVSTNFAYRVRCANSDWIQWRNLDTECAPASFGAMHRQNGALCVTAVSLADLPADPEAIYRGLSSLLTREDALKSARKIQERGLEGVDAAFSLTLSSGKEYSYRLKILHGGGFAWMAATWAESKTPQKEKIMDDALSRVEFLDTPRPPPDAGSLSPREKRSERMALNGIGLAYFNEQRFDRSERFFQGAIQLDDTGTNAFYLANLAEACIRAGHLRKALDALEQRPDFVDAQPALAADRAFLQGRLGDTDLAIANYAKLFSGGFNSEDHFREYMSLLGQTQQSKKALAEVEEYLKKQDSPSLRLTQAALLKQLKRFDDAATLLQEQHKKNPFHAGIAYALGDAFILSGKPAETLKISDEMSKEAGPTTAAWMLKGRAQLALKWYREAKESFENVLKETPADSDARQYVLMVSAILGEGSSAQIREAISPVDLPEELTRSLPEPPVNFGRDEGAFYTRQITAVSFEKGGELKTTERSNVRVISAAGVSAFSSFQISFGPLNEDVYVNELLVKDSAGELVSTGRISDFYVLDDRSGAAAGNRKVLNIPVPGLQPGYNIELILTRREFGRPEEFTFLPCIFAGAFSIQERDLYFTGDTNLIRFASAPPLAPKILPRGLLWSKAGPPVIRWEPMLPAGAEYFPAVYLSSASARWTDLATNYLETIRDRLELAAEQKQMARRLTLQATNLSQTISAIADYVQTNYTYKAIEFGRRARVPQAPADMVRNRYGDCKDHAVLAQQMLKAAGVPAALALVNLSAPIREDLPSLDQFNHMVVWVPAAGGNVFLDCTAKSFDLATLSNAGLPGRDALILDGEKSHFEEIPAYPANGTVIKLSRVIQITNRTDAVVHETVELNGVHAGWYREYYRDLPPASRRTYAASQFAGASSELTDFKIKGLDDPHAPLSFELEYLVRGQFHSMGKEISGSVPLNFERSLLPNQIVEKRTLPFEISIPLTIEASMEVHAPLHCKARALTTPVRSIQSQFVDCQFSSSASDSGWRLNYSLYEPSGRFPAERYSEHNRAMQQALEALAPQLVGVLEN